MIKKILCLLAVLVALYSLTGCALYNAAVDERNISEQYDDTVISASILKDMVNSDQVSPLDIAVRTYNGKVYLVGEIDSLAQKGQAISIARKTEGVREVTTYLLLKNDNDLCGTTDNLTMDAKLKKDLIGDKEIWSTNVTIDAVQCSIVLTGIVRSFTERDKIIAYARNIPKVRSVKSYIQVQ